MHPHRVVHPRLISRVAVLVAILAVSAPESGARCLGDSCAQRLLRQAARCFDPEGPCVRDDGSGVTCWANGARSTTFSFPDRGAERSIYVGPAGRRCQIVTSVPDADGFQRTTHVRKGRRVVFVASAAGLRVTCPGGRVERYTATELASPDCPPGPPPVTCEAGHCD